MMGRGVNQPRMLPLVLDYQEIAGSPSPNPIGGLWRSITAVIGGKFFNLQLARIDGPGVLQFNQACLGFYRVFEDFDGGFHFSESIS